jgi:hypothetical protein
LNVREVKAATLNLNSNGMKGVLTPPWVIVKEMAILFYTCPVLFLVPQPHTSFGREE